MANARHPAAPALLWFRRDLRLADNPALHAALEGGGPVVPVFILEEDEPVRAAGAAARWWLDKSLQALDAALEPAGSRLILRRGPAREVLEALVEETGATRLFWGRTYEPAADSRDGQIAKALEDKGVTCRALPGRLLVEPGEVKTQGGGLYGVFSPFWRKAESQIAHDKPLPTPKSLPEPSRWPRSEALKDLRLHPSAPDWSEGFSDWTPGEMGAQARLKAFMKDALPAYPHDRDLPAVDGSSRLSPHLAWGEISPRQLYCAAQARKEAHGLEPAVEKFLSEVAWRDFDYGLLAQQPDLAGKPFKPGLAKLKWRHSPANLKAWTQGRTGYPIVDAGMRQLWRMGWMHNRVRLIASSFLVKHLLIDWREGERWFWDCLVDADPANNPANWQWIAGVGADAQPFFRIFNPITQSEKFDGEGGYIRTWVPELKGLDRRWIHAPWDAPGEVLEQAGVRLGDTYPKPMVEHEAARARALAALEAARSGEGAHQRA